MNIRLSTVKTASFVLLKYKRYFLLNLFSLSLKGHSTPKTSPLQNNDMAKVNLLTKFEGKTSNSFRENGFQSCEKGVPEPELPSAQKQKSGCSH